MAAKIHLICKGKLGIVCIDKAAHRYTSAAWLLSSDEVAALAGGMVHFHETKSQPAYFGGSIVKLEQTADLPDGDPVVGKARYILTIDAAAKAKGVKWDKRGASHGMAWTSGVIVDDQ